MHRSLVALICQRIDRLKSWNKRKINPPTLLFYIPIQDSGRAKLLLRIAFKNETCREYCILALKRVQYFALVIARAQKCQKLCRFSHHFFFQNSWSFETLNKCLSISYCIPTCIVVPSPKNYHFKKIFIFLNTKKN